MDVRRFFGTLQIKGSEDLELLGELAYKLGNKTLVTSMHDIMVDMLFDNIGKMPKNRDEKFASPVQLSAYEFGRVIRDISKMLGYAARVPASRADGVSFTSHHEMATFFLSTVEKYLGAPVLLTILLNAKTVKSSKGMIIVNNLSPEVSNLLKSRFVNTFNLNSFDNAQDAAEYIKLEAQSRCPELDLI